MIMDDEKMERLRANAANAIDLPPTLKERKKQGTKARIFAAEIARKIKQMIELEKEN